MQDHEFEKKVHTQMEDLRVSPSDGVWTRVQKELHKDKRRRRIVLILAFIFLLGAGGYWLVNKTDVTPSVAIIDKKNNDTGIVRADLPAEKVLDKKNTDEPSIEPNNKTLRETKNPIAISENEKVPVSPVISSRHIALPSAKEDISKSHNKIQQIAFKRKNISHTKKGNQIVTEQIDSENKLFTEFTGAVAKKGEEERDIVPAKKIHIDEGAHAVTRIGKVSAINDSATISELAGEIAVTNTSFITANKKQQQKNRTWQWGATGTIGFTTIIKGGVASLLSLEKSAVADASANYGGANQLPGGPFNYRKPSIINADINAGIGFFVEHAISKRVKFTTGLQYNMFTTKNTIGGRVDSVRVINNNLSNSLLVDRFYVNGNTYDYISNYHFLELPVTISVQIVAGKKSPVYWNSGLSIGQLLSTNALHYDGDSNIYYKDNSLFRRTQIGFHSGFSIQLFNRSKHPLQIGPQMNYKLNDLLKQNNGDSRHLLSGGLMFKWYIRK